METGVPTTADYNGVEGVGLSKVQSSVHAGKRQSTYQAYLEPAKNRPNLHVLLDATVAKVTIPTFPRQSLFTVHELLCAVILPLCVALSLRRYSYCLKLETCFSRTALDRFWWTGEAGTGCGV